jgi:cytosine/adenosine deaminase-related metal-dependent hydrolase
MRSYQADWVYPIHTAPLRNGIVLVEEDGTVCAVFSPDEQEPALHIGLQPERLKGILVPGFVNTHCHLELSCMKGSIPEHRGMAGFVSDFVGARGKFSLEQRQEGIQKGEAEMLRNGIVAVGDISNDESSFSQKAFENLYYHTFIEAFDLNPTRTQSAFDHALSLRKEYLRRMPQREDQVAVVAHAPYTVTPDLHERIVALANKNNSILSIHSQESQAEEDLFMDGSGSLMEMYRALNPWD